MGLLPQLNGSREAWRQGGGFRWAACGGLSSWGGSLERSLWIEPQKPSRVPVINGGVMGWVLNQCKAEEEAGGRGVGRRVTGKTWTGSLSPCEFVTF